MPDVLGIGVSAELLDSWRGWFAPAVQPFRSSEPIGRRLVPSNEVRDTFQLYDDGPWVWLDEEEFSALSPRVRRALLARREATGRSGGQRFPWWPSVLAKAGDGPVIEYVEEGVRPSRHREVPAAVWRAARSVVPGAEALAGTFPDGSGPNCFGTVMAGAGVPGAESEWMVREPFEEWLARRTVPIRGTAYDDSPGVVLVWRDAERLVVHAAVTIGGGWAFSKPSQAWCSPRVVWTVRDTIKVNRHPRETLGRYRITS